MQTTVGVDVGEFTAPQDGFRTEQVNVIGEPQSSRTWDGDDGRAIEDSGQGVGPPAELTIDRRLRCDPDLCMRHAL